MTDPTPAPLAVEMPRRYTQWCHASHGHTMMPHDGGIWMLVKDHEAQLSARDAEVGLFRSALLDFLAYFRSGNAIPVERATIRADSMAVINGFAALAAKQSKQE